MLQTCARVLSFVICKQNVSFAFMKKEMMEIFTIDFVFLPRSDVVMTFIFATFVVRLISMDYTRISFTNWCSF
jgi:hypothetical protein